VASDDSLCGPTLVGLLENPAEAGSHFLGSPTRKRGGGSRTVLGSCFHDSKPNRPSLSPGPGSNQCARSRASRHGAAHDRSSQRRIRRPHTRGDVGPSRRVQEFRTGNRVSLVRYRRVGSRVRQHALARRQGAVDRDWRVREAMGRAGEAPRPASGRGGDGLDARRRSCGRRSEARGRSRPSHQSDSRRAQRNVNRCDEPSGRDSPRDRSGEASGNVLRRCCVVSRVHRSSSGRMGH